MTGRPCYRVEFSDGSAIVADADHQWLTQLRVSPGPARAVVDRCAGSRHERVVTALWTTDEIAATLRCPVTERRLSHSVRNTAPLDLPERDLPLPPYVLGVWLARGDSTSAWLSGVDCDVVMYVEAEGLHVVPRAAGIYSLRLPGAAQAGLPALNVLGHKHIPADYLRGSQRQRRALLAGLLDAAGVVTAAGSVQFGTPNARLAADVGELAVSLGYHCSIRCRRVEGRGGATAHARRTPPRLPAPSYTVTFAPHDDVFRVQAKRQAHKERLSRRVWCEESRLVTGVHRVRSVPVRCIQVDNDSQLYLAGRGMIPTHNSTLAMDFARSAAIRHDLTSVIFSLEMGRNEITMRLLSAEARVPLHTMRSGTMTDDDWTRLARRMGEVSSAPLFIDDSPNMTMMEIRAKCRRLKQRHDLRLVVVDYLQLMTSGKRVENRQQEVSEFSRSLKLLAKELDVPVIAISQLNRGPEQRTDKRPLLSDLRESGSLEQDSDMVILLHREDAYERESPRAGEADLIVAKHRNGPTATITVAFQGHYSRFVDMAHG
jgi:replicative DNA helicase